MKYRQVTLLSTPSRLSPLPPSPCLRLRVCACPCAWHVDVWRVFVLMLSRADVCLRARVSVALARCARARQSLASQKVKLLVGQAKQEARQRLRQQQTAREEAAGAARGHSPLAANSGAVAGLGASGGADGAAERGKEGAAAAPASFPQASDFF